MRTCYVSTARPSTRMIRTSFACLAPVAAVGVAALSLTPGILIC